MTKGLTSDIALYYYFMGLEGFTIGVQMEMERFCRTKPEGETVTEDDINQVYGLYVYNMHKVGRVHWIENPIKDKNGIRKIINEWDAVHINHNIDSIKDTLEKLERDTNMPIDYLEGQYNDYKRLTGRELYIFTSNRLGLTNVEGVETYKDKLCNLREVKNSKMLRGMECYRLEDVLDEYKKDGLLKYKKPYLVKDQRFYGGETPTNQDTLCRTWLANGLRSYLSTIEH